MLETEFCFIPLVWAMGFLFYLFITMYNIITTNAWQQWLYMLTKSIPVQKNTQHNKNNRMPGDLDIRFGDIKTVSRVDNLHYKYFCVTLFL